MRGKRGRPCKPLAAEEPTPSTARGLRPRRNLKPRVRDSGDEDVESPTREPPKPSRKRKRGSVTSTRGRGRRRGGGGRGGRGGRADRGGRRPAVPKAVVYDDHESEEEDDAVSLRSEEEEEEYVEEEPPSEEDEALKEESDCLEDVLDEVAEEQEEEDDASYCTESSFRSHSTHASTPGTPRSGAVLIVCLGMRCGCEDSNLEMQSVAVFEQLQEAAGLLFKMENAQCMKTGRG